MSAHKRRLVVAPEARQDLRDILLYTESRWDKRQVSTYKSKLDQAIHGLISFPFRGEAQDDISFGLRGLLVELHVIYYRVTDQSIIIVRVLHQNMDAARHIHP